MIPCCIELGTRGRLRLPCTLPHRHDPIALARTRAEHAVVADEMEARRRHERGEFLDEFVLEHGVQDDDRFVNDGEIIQ